MAITDSLRFNFSTWNKSFKTPRVNSYSSRYKNILSKRQDSSPDNKETERRRGYTWQYRYNQPSQRQPVQQQSWLSRLGAAMLNNPMFMGSSGAVYPTIPAGTGSYINPPGTPSYLVPRGTYGQVSRYYTWNNPYRAGIFAPRGSYGQLSPYFGREAKTRTYGNRSETMAKPDVSKIIPSDWAMPSLEQETQAIIDYVNNYYANQTMYRPPTGYAELPQPNFNYGGYSGGGYGGYGGGYRRYYGGGGGGYKRKETPKAIGARPNYSGEEYAPGYTRTARRSGARLGRTQNNRWYQILTTWTI